MDRQYLKFRSPRYSVFEQVTIGRVIDNRNFFKTGRVRVQYETIGTSLEVEMDVLQWWFGKESYRTWIPQIGNRVLIGLIDSALHFPVILGVLPPLNEPHPWENDNLEPKETREIYKAEDNTYFIRKNSDGVHEFQIVNPTQEVDISVRPGGKWISVSMGEVQLEIDGQQGKISFQAKELVFKGEKIRMDASRELTMGSRKIHSKSERFQADHGDHEVNSRKITLKSAKGILKG